MAHRPVGAGQSFATAAVASTSSAFNVQSSVLRLVTTDAPAFVAIGTDPVANNTDYYIPANTSATLALTKASQKVQTITKGSTTLIDCPEGTAMPFNIGDRVTLTAANDANWTTLINDTKVTAVNTTAGVSGFFGTRITVEANTSGISTAWSHVDSTLIRSQKVSGISTGGSKGAVYIQQVQTTGDA